MPFETHAEYLARMAAKAAPEAPTEDVVADETPAPRKPRKAADTTDDGES